MTPLEWEFFWSDLAMFMFGAVWGGVIVYTWLKGREWLRSRGKRDYGK